MEIKTMETIKEAYNEILDILKKHREHIVFDVNDLEVKANCHLFGIELKEKYGFNLEPREIKSLSWNRFGNYMYLMQCRHIGCSDDGRQPKDEMLLVLSFSTGAYIFGEDYPTKFFEDFFQELIIYEPKYCDSMNHSLYFSLDNAGKIFNDFNSILKKYYDLNRADIKQREIKKLEKRVAKLKLQEVK